MLVDWDLIVVIVISVPVPLIPSILFVRWRRALVDIVVFIVVSDIGVNICSRLRWAMSPLAMTALERRCI